MIDIVPDCYVHLLSLVEIGKGRIGLIHPSEIASNIFSELEFAIPVTHLRKLHPIYWCQTAFYVKEGIEYNSERYQLVSFSDSHLVLQHPKMDVNFYVRQKTKRTKYFSYKGGLKHPDFKNEFVIIDIKEEEFIDVIFKQTKEFIVGCNEEDYKT